MKDVQGHEVVGGRRTSGFEKTMHAGVGGFKVFLLVPILSPVSKLSFERQKHLLKQLANKIVTFLTIKITTCNIPKIALARKI